MATSSITHNFVISNPNSVKLFIAAIDEADRDRTPKQTLPGRQLTKTAGLSPKALLWRLQDGSVCYGILFWKNSHFLIPLWTEG